MLPDEYWIAGAATALVTGAVVLVHFEGLRFLADRLTIPHHFHRRRMVTIILALLLLHVIEVWLFGVTYYYMLMEPIYGSIEGTGTDTLNLVDSVYFSATVYTTLGFGDLYPVGPVRVMTGTEGITGLTMITWSASYTFVEMSKVWNDRN